MQEFENAPAASAVELLAEGMIAAENAAAEPQRNQWGKRVSRKDAKRDAKIAESILSKHQQSMTAYCRGSRSRFADRFLAS